MDSRYVGRHFCAAVGHRKYAEARDSKEGKNVISKFRGRVGMCHEMDIVLSNRFNPGTFLKLRSRSLAMLHSVKPTTRSRQLIAIFGSHEEVFYSPDSWHLLAYINLSIFHRFMQST